MNDDKHDLQMAQVSEEFRRKRKAFATRKGGKQKEFPHPCKPNRAGKINSFSISQITKNVFANTTPAMNHAINKMSAQLIVNAAKTITRSCAVKEDAKVCRIV